MEKNKFGAEVMDLADRLSQFFLVFDALLLHDSEAKRILAKALEDLEERIAFNEASMAVIMALGGQYDSAEDKAKAAEIRALLDLMRAREETRKAAVVNADKKADAQQTLMTVFGISS